MPRELKLPRSLHAPRLARGAVARWYGGSLPQDELEEAKLVTSELVTNALVHGSGRITLRADSDDDRVLLEVMDEGAGFEYALRKVPFDEVSGRGLTIIDATASRWGIHEGSTHVWAEMERKGPRLGASKKPGPT